MASKEIMLHLAEMLQKLGTHEPRLKRAGVKFTIKDVEKRMLQRESNKAKRFMEGALSGDKKTREEARTQIQSEAYQVQGDKVEPGALVAETNSLVKSQKAPAFLPEVAYVTPEVALYYKRLSELPPELRTSSIYLQEAMCLYYSTDWASATTPVVRQTREIIERTFREAKNIAPNTTDANISLIDEQVFWEATDERYDLYRTTRIEGAEEFEVPEDQLKQILRDPEKARRYALHRKLLKTQKWLDNINDDRVALEKTLTDLREVLGKNEKEGTDEPLYNEKEAQTQVEKLNKKLGEIHAQKEKREEELSGGRRHRGGETEASLHEDSDLQTIMEQAQSEELRLMAEKLLTERKKIGIPELVAMNNQLKRCELESRYYGETVGKMKGKLLRMLQKTDPDATVDDVVLTNEDICGPGRVELARLRKLREIIERRFEEKATDRASHSWWTRDEGIKERRFIMTMDKVKGRDGQEISAKEYFESPDLLSNPSTQEGDTMNRLNEDLFNMLQAADDRPKDPFNDAIQLYEQADFTQFMRDVRERLGQLGVDETRIQDIMTHFTGLRNAKEFAHNLVYIHNFGDLETLGKFISTLQSGEINIMYRHIPGIEMAQHIREGLLNRCEGNNRYLTPDYFVGGLSQWEKDTRAQFDRNVNGGLLRDAQGNAIHLTEWQKKNAIEFSLAIDVADLRFSEQMTRAVGGSDYASSKGENLGLDPIHGIFHKFKAKKPAVYLLYFTMTGDYQTARKMITESWDLDRVLNQVDSTLARPDSVYGRRLGDIKGLLDISGRWGFNSQWGIRRTTEGLSSEAFAHRGVGFELNAARNNADARIRGRETGIIVERVCKKYKITLPENPAERQKAIDEIVKGENGKEKQAQEIDRLINTKMQEKTIQDEITREAAQEAYDVLDRTAKKLPLVVIRRMAVSVGPQFRQKRFEILQQFLGDRLLQGPDGAWIEVTLSGAKKPVKTFQDLFDITGENKGGQRLTPEDHLSPNDNAWAQAQWKEFLRQSDQLEGDLSLAQEAAVVNNHHVIQEDDYNALRESLRHEAGSDGKPLTQEAIEARVQKAKDYAEAIYQAATKTQGGLESTRKGAIESDQEKHSYIMHMANRIVRGQEKGTFTTEDARYSTFKWSQLGDRGVLRGVLDAVSAIKGGGEGLGKYLEAMTGHPEAEELAMILRKEFFVPIASMDDTVAQRLSYWFGLQTVRYYAESPYYSYSGFFGDILGLGIVQNQLSRWGKYTWLSSFNKAVADPTGSSWGPDDRFKFIHALNNVHVLPKAGPIDMWGVGEDFSAHHMENITDSTPFSVVKEYGSYVLTGVPLLITGVAIKEEAEKESKES